MTARQVLRKCAAGWTRWLATDSHRGDVVVPRPFGGGVDVDVVALLAGDRSRRRWGALVEAQEPASVVVTDPE